MKIITKPLIEQTVKQMHDIVLSIFPKWHTVFSGEIGYFESKYTVAEATKSGELKSMGVKFKYTLTSYYKYLDGSDLVETINFSRMTKKQQTMLDHPEKIICKDRYGATLQLIRSDLTLNY